MVFVPGNIALKVKATGSLAKCISILRKYNPGSIAEIKTAIESNDYVLSYRYTSDSGIRKIRRCYDELTKNGFEAELFEHDKLTDHELLTNLLNTYREIEEETEALIDAEAEDFESDE